MPCGWRRERISPNVFKVTTPCSRNSEWEAWALLSSDRHWDNPKSDRDLQIEHLELAKERGAIVLDCGDLFCAMQGKYDKRASKSQVRPEHQVDNYLDKIVEDAAEFFRPYRDNILFIGEGNHETAVRKNHEIDLTERLVSQLNIGSKTEVFNGHYGGFVQFSFSLPACKLKNNKVASTNSTLLHYDHGWGGGGPVTKDTIQHQRRAVYLPDAQIVISGHVHEGWVMEFARVRVSNELSVFHDIQTHIKMPTYKEEYGSGKGGWHIETGKGPKPLGAWWLRFYWSRKHEKVLYEVIRAS